MPHLNSSEEEFYHSKWHIKIHHEDVCRFKDPNLFIFLLINSSSVEKIQKLPEQVFFPSKKIPYALKVPTPLFIISSTNLANLCSFEWITKRILENWIIKVHPLSKYHAKRMLFPHYQYFFFANSQNQSWTFSNPFPKAHKSSTKRMDVWTYL